MTTLSQKQKWLVTGLLFLSIIFFIAGLSLPLLSTKKQIFGITLQFEKIWLFTSIKFFLQQKEYFLSFIILFFTFLFPIVKYFDLFNKIFKFFTPNKKVSHILSITDKWSMLDVFLVALLLLNYKMDSEIIVMKLRIGTSLLAVSIISRMFVNIIISRIDENKQHLANNRKSKN